MGAAKRARHALFVERCYRVVGAAELDDELVGSRAANLASSLFPKFTALFFSGPFIDRRSRWSEATPRRGSRPPTPSRNDIFVGRGQV